MGACESSAEDSKAHFSHLQDFTQPGPQTSYEEKETSLCAVKWTPGTSDAPTIHQNTEVSDKHLRQVNLTSSTQRRVTKQTFKSPSSEIKARGSHLSLSSCPQQVPSTTQQVFNKDGLHSFSA